MSSAHAFTKISRLTGECRCARLMSTNASIKLSLSGNTARCGQPCVKRIQTCQPRRQPTQPATQQSQPQPTRRLERLKLGPGGNCCCGAACPPCKNHEAPGAATNREEQGFEGGAVGRREEQGGARHTREEQRGSGKSREEQGRAGGTRRGKEEQRGARRSREKQGDAERSRERQ